MTNDPRRDRLLIIYLCFFTSGVAGLIYENLWNKYLALFIGSTGRAHVMTLAVFMGGLALGSWVFGRRSDRVRNPLAIYILLEVGVGIYGLAYPFLFEPYRNGFIALARALGLTDAALMTAKLVFCTLTILVPTFLMGGTFPVLGRYLVTRMADVGPRIATLYYVNTFGAFVGCLLAGFIMIPTYGLHVSMMIAAGLNFAVCILASLLFQEKYRALDEDETGAGEEGTGRMPVLPGDGEAEERTGTMPLPPVSLEEGAAGRLEACPAGVLYPKRMRAVVLATIGVSGFVAMVYEIAWIRLLTLVVGASTYSFSLMVATFIFGIALGSFLLSFKQRERGYDAIFGWAELGLALSVLAMLPLVEHVPFWFNRLASLFVREPHAFGLYMFVQLLVCFILMLVPTVLLGMTLPAATRVVTDRVGRVGSRIGTVYALNTIGTLLGAGAAGLIFLPTVGLKHTFEIGIVLNLACGLVVVWMLAGRLSRAVRGIATAFCALAFVAYLAFVPQWDKNVLSSGVFRQRGRFYSFQSMLDMLNERDRMLYYKDGVDASIAVIDSEGTRSLLINGKADASDTGDMSTQILIAHYPLLSRPDSREVLVIGMGSGVSIGSALQYPVEHVDAVEISKEVVEAATEHFAEANLRFAESTSVTIHVEDAKTFLLLTEKQYDVIVSEPTNPWIAGVAGLFSKEFYETCRGHLKDDGLILQWIPVYELQDSALMSILRTFTDAFPYFVIWNMNRYDIAIMGSPSPFQPDFAGMEKLMGRPAVARDLKRLGIEHPLAFLATQVFVNSTATTTLFQDAVVNSDFRPYLEYKAPVGFFTGSHALGIKSLDMRAWPRHSRTLWIDAYRPTRPPTREEFAAFHKILGTAGSLFDGKMEDWTARWRDAHPDDPDATDAWIEAHDDRPDWQREQLAKAVERFPKDDDLADRRARLAVRLLDNEAATTAAFEQARAAIAHADALRPKQHWPNARLLVEVEYRAGRMLEVLKHGVVAFPHLADIRATEGDEATFAFLRMICEAAIASGKRNVAQQCLDEMQLIRPRDLRRRRLESVVAGMER